MSNSTDIILRNVENTFGSTVMRPGMRSKIFALILILSLFVTGCQGNGNKETSTVPAMESGASVLFDNEPVSAFRSCRYQCLDHCWTAELTAEDPNYATLLKTLSTASLEKIGKQASGRAYVFSFQEKPEITLSISPGKQGPLTVSRKIDGASEMSYRLSEDLSDKVRTAITALNQAHSFDEFAGVPYQESILAAQSADGMSLTDENGAKKQLSVEKQKTILGVLSKYAEQERLTVWSDFEKDRTENVAKYVFSSNGAEVASFTVCRYGSLLGLRCDRTEMIYKLPQEAFDELLAIQ